MLLDITEPKPLIWTCWISRDLSALSLRSQPQLDSWQKRWHFARFLRSCENARETKRRRSLLRDTVSRLSAETTTKTTITLMMTCGPGLCLSLCFSCVAFSLSLSLSLSYFSARSVIWTVRRVAIGPWKGSLGRNGMGARETTDELGRDRGRKGREGGGRVLPSHFRENFSALRTEVD